MADAELSFHDFVQARIAALSRVAFLLTGDPHLAEDLVQQALIKVASRWERLVAQGDPEPYVRRVLYNNHISWWRRHRREATPLAKLPEGTRPDHAAGVDMALTLSAALASLAPRQRAVLVLRFYEDLSEQQTAIALGCSVNTVKSHPRRQGKSGAFVEKFGPWAAPRRSSEAYGWPGLDSTAQGPTHLPGPMASVKQIQVMYSADG